VVRGGLLIGNGTANTGTQTSFQNSLLRFYHGQCDVLGTWLANFSRKDKDSSPELTAISDTSASSADYTNRVKALKFFGSGYRVLFFSDCPYYDAAQLNYTHWFADLDGSVRGDGHPVYITNRSMLLRTDADHAIYRGVGTAWLEDATFGTISPLDHGIMRLDTDGDPTFTRTDGITGHGGSPGVNMSQRYEVSGSFSSINDFHARGSDPGWVDLVFTWTGRANPSASYTADSTHYTVKQASSLANLGKDGQFFVTGGKLYLRIQIGGSPVPFMSGSLTSLRNPDQHWNIA
jgi:hypothetical protein